MNIGQIIKTPKGRYFRVKSKLDDSMDLEPLTKSEVAEHLRIARINERMPEYAPPKMYLYSEPK